MIRLYIDSTDKMYVSVIGYSDTIASNKKIYMALNKYGVNYNNILELAEIELDDIKALDSGQKLGIANTAQLTFQEVATFVSIDEMDILGATILEIPPNYIKTKLEG